MILRVALAGVVLTITTLNTAAAGKFDDWRSARTHRNAIWTQVYRDGGQTLYCHVDFHPSRRVALHLNIEHVYPMYWATLTLGCGSRKGCRRSLPGFADIENDLHNLYPARRLINRKRGNFRFGEVDGERRRFGRCDVEISSDQGVIEPAEERRGEIARAVLYMLLQHDLRIPDVTQSGIRRKIDAQKQLKLLIEWHQLDPPDAEEQRRNNVIEKLQGNRNPFIDEPRSEALISAVKRLASKAFN